jgi:hypothetical protein
MKYLLFTLITLMCSVCYGQVPITKDRLLLLVTGPDTCGLSRDASKHFNEASVRKHMSAQGIQFIQICGNDMTGEWRAQNKITHYPSVVYYMKKDGKLTWAKTYSGLNDSRAIGKLASIRTLLGMKAETYRAPNNNPLIPGSQAPPQQYIARPQQQAPQPYCPPGGS